MVRDTAVPPKGLTQRGSTDVYTSTDPLAQAHRLICNTNRSISDIARSCGYCNSGYLINLFRKAYGESPVAYRNNQPERLRPEQG